jgi:hypothetical protein
LTCVRQTVIVARPSAGNGGLIPGETLHFAIASRSAFGSKQSHIQRLPAALSTADCLLPSSTEEKNVLQCTLVCIRLHDLKLH